MSFINDNFLLKSKTAQDLYKKFAENQPIIDYHCHINPYDIYTDRKFDNITQIWLGGDHYKWRLIRTMGVCEEEITGSQSDKEKFMRFAEMLPLAIGNPMYHWTHLELKRYFGYDKPLSPDTAEEVWALTSRLLPTEEFSAKNIIRRSGVKMIGTTDDPTDDLRYHKLISEDKNFDVLVLPSYRPDKALNIEKDGFTDYIARLSDASGIAISSLDELKKALSLRLEYFASLGCRASDHGLDYVPFALASDDEVDRILKSAISGEKVSLDDADKFKTHMLVYLGGEYTRLGIVMQIHYGAQRNTNTKMFKRLGPDTGYDCISTRCCAEAITALLNELEKQNSLPKTVIYSLNGGDNELIDSIIGCFQGEGVVSKIQHGSAWWFNDTKSGMEAQLKSLANLSLLGGFIGMLTDSRSLLSYTRHEYFRRILCAVIAKWVDDGEYPYDEKALGKIISGICYENARVYFNL